MTVFLFAYAYFMAEPAFAGITAEYKCTTDCNLCITFDSKKTICSEKYEDDSDQYEFAKKIGRLVNDGLLIPTPDLKVGFALGAFAKKFFNCDLMVKKAEQIKQATENMCKKSVAAYREREMSQEKPSSRGVASVRSSRSSDSSGVREKSSGSPIREIKKAQKAAVKESVAPAKEEAQELAPPPAPESMDDLIRQMDE